MFGESESESPRAPSPWDSLMSASPSPSPAPRSRVHTPSPLAAELIPKLVPESDDGNVEYKLQLLNPSPARFARLVTQMKWRLLEGGGQAYYELGVADSGDLVGLTREELEQTLTTLDMMAGEIGASVIIVKEIEVPPALAQIAKRSGDRRRHRGVEEDDDSGSASALTTETEGSLSASDVDFTDETDDLSRTVVLGSARVLSNDSSTSSLALFSMDPECEADDAGVAVTQRFAVDLEIASVFKPRPTRTGLHHFQSAFAGGKNKRAKKHKFLPAVTHGQASNGDTKHKPYPEQVDGADLNGEEPRHKNGKAFNRRQTRDRKREEKRKALASLAAQSIGAVPATNEDSNPIPAPIPVPAVLESDTIVSGLATLQISAAAEPASVSTVVVESNVVVEGAIPSITVNDDDVVDDDDVFPNTAKASFPTFDPATTGESHLDVDPAAVKLVGALDSGSPSNKDQLARLIVEALVVRKMSLDEAFLDFGGFSTI